MRDDRRDDAPGGADQPVSPERALRVEIDRLRLENQRLRANAEPRDPFDRLLVPARRAWRAAWQQYYIARWHLLHARDPRRGLKPRDDHAPYRLRPRHDARGPRPRILHVVGNFHTGGSARLIVDLVEHLGHLYEQQVLVRSLPATPAYTGIDLIHRPVLWRTAQVSAVLRGFQPDLVHVHMLGHQHDEYGRRDWSWYHKVMVALENHGLPVIENLNIPVEPYVSPVVRIYVHVSDFVRQRFGRLDAWNETIHPGSDLDFFLRGDRPVPDDCIGMIYRLQPDKLDEAPIEPFIRVVARRPATRALIVGGGQFFDAYRQRVAECGVQDSFTFTGFVPYNDLPDHLAQMSVFVAPVHAESFGQVGPFAMGFALPVAGYRVGALEEIAGTSDLLVPAGDAEQLADVIIALLDDRPRRLAIGQQNRRRAERLFSIDTMIERYRSIYTEVLSAPRAVPLRLESDLQNARYTAPAGDAPAVTVLMSVFNGEKYVREAIESVLTQTYRSFEFLIVNDGSTDRTGAILSSYDDPRIAVLENPANIGLSRSLNKGIGRARGRYIARMDADDVCEPDRLERQVDYLSHHPGVIVVGSWYKLVDEDGGEVGRRCVPCDDTAIRWMLDFCSPFAHSAVMIRRQALEGDAYDETLRYAMDYDLWTRLARRGRLANLDSFLVRWRISPGSLTSRFGDRTERFDRVLAAIRERLGWPVDDETGNEQKGARLCAIVSGATPDDSVEDVEAAIGMLLELNGDFCRRNHLSPEAAGTLRESVLREASRVLLWMGHRYPDHRNYGYACRALAAAYRLRRASLATTDGLGLAMKLMGGRPAVSAMRRLTKARAREGPGRRQASRPATGLRP